MKKNEPTETNVMNNILFELNCDELDLDEFECSAENDYYSESPSYHFPYEIDNPMEMHIIYNKYSDFVLELFQPKGIPCDTLVMHIDDFVVFRVDEDYTYHYIVFGNPKQNEIISDSMISYCENPTDVLTTINHYIITGEYMVSCELLKFWKRVNESRINRRRFW